MAGPIFRQPNNSSAPWQLAPANNNVSRFRNWVDPQGSQFSEDYFVYQANVPILAASGTVMVPINIQQDSGFEWIYTTGGSVSASGGGSFQPFTVQVIDQTSGRNLFSDPIPCQNIAGDGQFPFILPIPRRFLPKTTINVVFTNLLAGQIVNASVQLIGRKIYYDRGGLGPGVANQPFTRFRQYQGLDPITGQTRLLTEDLFAYDLNFGNLGVGQPATSGTVNKLVEADSDFEWIMATGFANAADLSAFFTWQQISGTLTITDGGSNRALVSAPIFMSDIVGTGKFPFILPVPRMFLAKTTIQATLNVTDTAALGFANIHLTLWGRKIFEMH